MWTIISRITIIWFQRHVLNKCFNKMLCFWTADFFKLLFSNRIIDLNIIFIFIFCRFQFIIFWRLIQIWNFHYIIFLGWSQWLDNKNIINIFFYFNKMSFFLFLFLFFLISSIQSLISFSISCFCLQFFFFLFFLICLFYFFRSFKFYFSRLCRFT